MGSDEYFLGIEGTAHTTAVGIVDKDNNIIADQRKTFKPKTGGIHPRDAANFIAENITNILAESFSEANVDPDQITAIAFSQGPGIGPCLRATATAARSLSLTIKKPLIGVNHALAHIELGVMVCKLNDPLTLYVSGGNTQLTEYSNHRYHILGETQDIAIGNMIDTVARGIGYDYALAGPIIEMEAKKGTKLLDLPYSIKGTSVSYSGLLTAAIRAYEEFQERPEDIAYSIQEIGFAMLAEITEKCLIVSGKKELLVTGGVAANKRLREMLSLVAEENNAEFSFVPPKLAGDNGVMIAVTGAKFWKNGRNTLSIEESFVKPKWRIDEITIPW